MQCRDLVLVLLAVAGCGDDSGPAASTAADTAATSAAAGSSDGGAASTSADSTDSSVADSSGDSSTGDTGECWDDLPIGEVEVLTDAFIMGSEGLAFGIDGKLYATTIDAGVGTVWRIEPDGTTASFSELPYALGLAPLADGGFVVASIGETMAPDGGVYRVDAKGEATLLTDGTIESPNFVVISPEGSALVSDDFDTRVFRVGLDGSVSVAIEDVPSPNGMAYSPDGSTFYVASTFTEDGQLTRYDVDAEGFPDEATATEIFALGPASTLDGIAVDENGFVYMAANLKGEVWRVDGSATSVEEGELVAGSLGSPASLAFGNGSGFDPCSLYSTELFGRNVVRISVGVRGAPLYY